MDNRWNKEYAQGAHWEKGPSSQMKKFIKYLKPGYEVLDAGCGSGRDSIFLAKQGYVVTGVDISDVGIQKAKTHSKEQNLNIKFDVGNLENLVIYTDKQFDAVYSGYTLQRTDLKKSSKELARILKPNGIAYIVMFELIKYDKPSERDLEIDHDYILKTFSDYFKILNQEVDEYFEDDQLGRHKHRRLVLVLRKK